MPWPNLRRRKTRRSLKRRVLGAHVFFENFGKGWRVSLFETFWDGFYLFFAL